MKTELTKTAAIDGKLETMVESAYPDFEWRLSRMLSEKMEKIVAIMLETQKQVLEYKLTIQLDLSKKSEYAKVNQLNQSIIAASEKIDRELSDILIEGQAIVFDLYKQWQEKLERHKKNEEFYNTAKTHIFKLLDDLEDKVNKTIETTKYYLDSTVELLNL